MVRPEDQVLELPNEVKRYLKNQQQHVKTEPNSAAKVESSQLELLHMVPSFRRRTKASVALNYSFSSAKKQAALIEDELYTLMRISGIECLLQASNTNGMIKGIVSTPMTSNSFKFDFAPCQTRNINIKQEILRLYFNTRNQVNEKVQNPKLERDFSNAVNELDLVQKENIE